MICSFILLWGLRVEGYVPRRLIVVLSQNRLCTRLSGNILVSSRRDVFNEAVAKDLADENLLHKVLHNAKLELDYTIVETYV